MALTLLARGSLAQNHWLIAYSMPTGSLDWSVNNGPSQLSTLPLHLERVGGQSTTKAVSITETATQTITLTWVDSYGKPAPNPPSRVSLKVSSIAQWNAEADTFSGTADNGQGDAMVVTDYGGSGGGSSEGAHLRRYDGSNGVITVTVTCSQSVQATGSGWVEADVQWDFRVALDDRGITLSRDGARGETVDADGTVHGDTVYSYYSVHTAPEAPFCLEVLNWQVFHPLYSGGWSARWDQLLGDIPDAVWAWAPDCTRDTQFDGYKSMSFGVLEEVDGCDWEGGPGVRSMHTTTYTATDRANGATCTAKYILTVHEPYEKNYPDVVTPTVPENWRNLEPSLPWGENTGGEYTSVTVSYTVGHSWGLSASFTGKVAEWIAKVLGISLTASVTASTTAGISITAPNVPPGYATCLLVADVYDHHDGNVDEWDVGGYVGMPDYHIKVPSTPPCTIGYYWPYQYIGW